MCRRYFVTTGLVALTLLCGYLGYALGNPSIYGPCNSDDSSTCAFTCKVVQNESNEWVASTDQTQVPYCANQTGACDPKASTTKCTVYTFTNPTCTGQGTPDSSYDYCCKTGS